MSNTLSAFAKAEHVDFALLEARPDCMSWRPDCTRPRLRASTHCTGARLLDTPHAPRVCCYVQGDCKHAMLNMACVAATPLLNIIQTGSWLAFVSKISRMHVYRDGSSAACVPCRKGHK